MLKRHKTTAYESNTLIELSVILISSKEMRVFSKSSALI